MLAKNMQRESLSADVHMWRNNLRPLVRSCKRFGYLTPHLPVAYVLT